MSSFGGAAADRALDFFISYTPADERWATWIAWELESAGYTIMVQAWDFVPGTNFVDFMDRGLRSAKMTIAVVSENYLQSRYGTLEWQAAVAHAPRAVDRLVTVRVDDCQLDGLLATVTWVNLAEIPDAEAARVLLLGKIREALKGRAKPDRPPSFPAGPTGPTAADQPAAPAVAEPSVPRYRRGRGGPVTPPVYPPAAPAQRGPRSAVTVLHLPGPRFAGRPTGDGPSAAQLQDRIWAELTRLTDDGAPAADLVLVSGNLTASGRPGEFAQAAEFLTGLRVLIGLEPHRLALVPGDGDLSRQACEAYFANCDADEIDPMPPYWPKWRHFHRLFQELYDGLDDLTFDSQQPWTLFGMADLKVVVAGLNSTMQDSHRPDDHFGWIGPAQAAWFAHRLRPYEEAGWLRIGLVRHRPVASRPAADADPDVLRDTATVDQTVGRHLNLLVCGPGPAGGAISTLRSTVPVVPPFGSAPFQLLQLTVGGLTRWGDKQVAGAAPATLRRRWSGVGGTFLPDAADAGAGPAGRPAVESAAGPGAPDRPAGWPPAEVEDVRGPADDLLDRIAEACETRYDNARIRRVVDGPLPYLVVTYRDGDETRRRQVAAHIGELTGADVELFLSRVQAVDPESACELVYDGPRISQALRDEAARRQVRVRSFLEFQGMLDLRDFVSAQTSRLRGDPLYPPGRYVPQRFRELVGGDRRVRSGLVEELMRQVTAEDGRFVLVLGDFGRGKTFALREVAMRIPTEQPTLIPLFIELRALDKAHSVPGLVAAHLADYGEEHIDLKAFSYMLRQGRIVLLFDGFDELVARVTYERAAAHLETLVAAAEGNAKIIVSSRSQHFKTDAQVFTALGERVGLLPNRRLVSIEDFTVEQIRQYLVNFNDGDEAAADSRLALLAGAEDLVGLARNPRMLSFIAGLDEGRLRTVVQAKGVVSAARLYNEVLDAWLRYEERRTQGVLGAPPGLTRDELWEAAGRLAVRLWESDQSLLQPAEVLEVADTLTAMTAQLSAEQAQHAVGGGSLLVRTEDGLFGFIHGSVVEWLVAREIATGIAADRPPALLSRRPLSQLTVDFLCDLAPSDRLRGWMDGVLGDGRAAATPRQNALKIASRLRTTARTDLRGADLRGVDLSHRDLTDADLSGADLTDARLVGTKLVRANLREARLVGARLDETALTGADLTGADLTRARLRRADLRDVVLTDSSWRRAVLVDVTAGREVLEAPELRGATVAAGHRVDTEFRPAAVGVQYGFEYGRLPRPTAYSSDGELLAIGSDDGGVLICDTVTGRPVRTLRAHSGRVYAVAYGPGDRVLATAASDGTAIIWDPATGRRLHTLRGHQDWVWPMALSPDGDVLLTGDHSGEVRVWDTATGRLRQTLAGHDKTVWSVSFRPDGAQLATGDGSGVVRLWDPVTGELRCQLAAHKGAVYRVAFSPDGRLLGAADHGGQVSLWDIDGGATLRARLTGHTTRVYALAFHPSGELLASGDVDGAVSLWDVATGRSRGRLTGHTGAVYWVTFSPDGALLASGDSDGAVCLWEPDTGRLRHRLTDHRGSVWPASFRPDGGQLATSSNDGTTQLWDPQTGHRRHLLRGHGRQITSVGFSPDGSLLATSGNDGVVRLWQTGTGQRDRELSGYADRLVSAFFNPAQPQLATANSAGGMYLWNVQAGTVERELNVSTDHIWAAAFSPDGDVLATSNDDDSVRLWYRTTGRQIQNLADHRGRVRSIAFSPDGRLVATGCDDRKVRLWEADTGACLSIMEGHTDRVYAVVFNRDGSRLLSASNDGTARLWDPSSGVDLGVLARHSGRLWTAAYSPDGAVAATAGDDLVVRLWDVRSGEQLRALPGHTRRVWSVAFSPDGQLLASGGDDGTVHVWDVADPPAARRRMTLLGLPDDGWAALSPDGSYKLAGDAQGQFWHVIGMSRFDPGELDDYVAEVRQVPLAAEL